MPGNYRYEEERNRGRGAGHGGFGERERDDDGWQGQQNERFGRGPDYEGERGQGSRRDYSQREYSQESDDRGGEGFGQGSHGQRQLEGGYYGHERNYREGNRGQESSYGHSGYGQGNWGQTGSGPGYRGQRGSEMSRYENSQSDGGTGGESHVGKGPKNWKRSDERIREDVNEALARHPEIDASELEVRVQGGEITLTGTVADRRAKRQAEDVAERVFGANDVQNQIRVKGADGASKDRFSEREQNRTVEREGRAGTESQSGQTRSSGSAPGATAR